MEILTWPARQVENSTYQSVAAILPPLHCPALPVKAAALRECIGTNKKRSGRAPDRFPFGLLKGGNVPEQPVRHLTKCAAGSNEGLFVFLSSSRIGNGS